MPYPRQCPARRDGTGRQEKMTAMARYPDSTKTSLEQRLRARARERWPQIASLQIRHRGVFSFIDATLADATTLKLCRLRYVGSASHWQFAIYRASHDDYDESVFFTGLPVGTCQDALDTACGLYLNDPTAWTRHPTNLRARPLSRRHLPQDADHFFGTGAELPGVPRVAGRGPVQLIGSLVRGEGGRPGDVRAMPALGDDDAGRLKFPVGPGHGTGREPEVGGELPDRRKPASRRQHPA
jgi:hypothetical protein